MLFPMGRLLATPGALEKISQYDINIALGRHQSGDWGDVCDEDKRLNDEALRNGARLFSAYHTQDGRQFWIITEADRSATTVLLPSEY